MNAQQMSNRDEEEPSRGRPRIELGTHGVLAVPCCARERLPIGMGAKGELKKNNIRERKEAGIAITLVLSGPQTYDTRDARLSSGWARFIILRFVLFRTYEVVSAYRFTKTPAAKSATDRNKNERKGITNAAQKRLT